MKCKHGIKDCKNDGKEEICGACNIKDFMGAPEYEPEKENANSGYPPLGEVRAVITEMLLPHISSDSEDVAITKMYALRNSYIDTYNNTIRDVLKKLSEHFA